MEIVQEKTGNVFKYIFENPFIVLIGLVIIIVVLDITKVTKKVGDISMKNIITSSKLIFFAVFFIGLIGIINKSELKTVNNTIFIVVALFINLLLVYYNLFNHSSNESLLNFSANAFTIISSIKILCLIGGFFGLLILINNSDAMSLKNILFVFTILSLSLILINALFNDTSKENLLFFTMNVLSFLMIGYVILLIIFPNNKELTIFLIQNMSVVYIILNIAATIMFYKLLPSTLNKYKNIILPVQIISFVFLFFMSLKGSTNSDFSLKYERLKYISIFITFISTIVIMYSIYGKTSLMNTETSHNMMLFLGLMMAGTFIFLMLFLDLYSDDTTKIFNDASFFDKCSSAMKSIILRDKKFYVNIIVGSIFLLLLFCVCVGVYFYPNGFLNNSETAPFILFMMLIIFILWILFFTISAFPKILSNGNPIDISKMSSMRFGIGAAIGFILAVFFISWGLQYIHKLSSTSTFASALLNITILIFIITLLFKLFNVSIPSAVTKQSTGFFNKTGGIILSLSQGLKTFILKNIPIAVLTIIVSIFVIIIMFNTMKTVAYNLYYNMIPKSKKLLSEPITTENETILATYDKLNVTSLTSSNVDFNYNYGISFWFYINALSPNTKVSYSKFASLLSYGNKPNILYNATKNELIVTIQQSQDSKNTKLNDVLSYDSDGNLLVYTNPDIMLQKWNNMVINYTYGTLDIFLNGDLVKSAHVDIPYMTLDDLVIGEPNGINAKINNVEYFKDALTASEISKVSKDTSNLY
jgi:hypothetical protein